MRFRLRRVLEILAVVLVLAALPYGYYRWRSSNALNEILAELEGAGEPWKLADLEARRKDIDPDKDAAVLIRKTRLPAVRKFPLEEAKPAPNEVLTPAQQAEIREFLDKLGENVETARNLADYPQGRFYVTIAPDVISTLIPHVQDVRELCMVLQYDVWLRAQQADFEGATRTCHASINAARTLRDELFLISHLVRLAMLRETANSTERLLGQGQAPVEVLAKLQRQFQDEADFDGLTVALQGERAGMHQLFEHIATNKADLRLLRGLAGGGHLWRHAITDAFVGVTAEQSHAWILRHSTDELAALALPRPERAARLKELHARVEKAPALAKILSAPVWKNCYPVFARSEAKLGCTIAGLAAEQFRRKHERWPKTLDELSPEFLEKAPRDPYTGEPLRLRVVADGIVIYSPGPDGELRGAGRDQALNANDEQRILDHEFRLWNVDQRRRVAK